MNQLSPPNPSDFNGLVPHILERVCKLEAEVEDLRKKMNRSASDLAGLRNQLGVQEPPQPIENACGVEGVQFAPTSLSAFRNR